MQKNIKSAAIFELISSVELLKISRIVRNQMDVQLQNIVQMFYTVDVL